MPDINFLEIFHLNQDKPTLISMTNELVELYGFPCELRRWNGIQPVLDPLYQDSPTIFNSDEDLYDIINTYVYVDYNRFSSVLSAYGYALNGETTINGVMKLEDEPKADDIIKFKLPYDEKLPMFKLGLANIHKDICYNVVLDIYHSETGAR